MPKIAMDNCEGSNEKSQNTGYAQLGPFCWQFSLGGPKDCSLFQGGKECTSEETNMVKSSGVVYVVGNDIKELLSNKGWGGVDRNLE